VVLGIIGLPWGYSGPMQIGAFRLCVAAVLAFWATCLRLEIGIMSRDEQFCTSGSTDFGALAEAPRMTTDFPECYNSHKSG
jgi:hypothetical protein